MNRIMFKFNEDKVFFKRVHNPFKNINPSITYIYKISIKDNKNWDV